MTDVSLQYNQFHWPSLLPVNEVWGKVIFSEACVKNSVYRGCLVQGGVCSWGDAWSRGGLSAPGGGVCSWEGGMPGQGWWWCPLPGGIVAPGGGAWSGGGGLLPGVPGGDPRTATAADGTHPTGMHSCLQFILITSFTKFMYSGKRQLNMFCLLSVY